jgi:hypothetical protein
VYTNYIRVIDDTSLVGHSYVVDRNLVQRTDRAALTFQSARYFSVALGAASDQVTVRDTPSSVKTRLYTIGGSDLIQVARTTGALDVTAGESSVLELGTATTSLDAIQGAISVYPAADNRMVLRLNDAAATAHQSLTVDTNAQGQTYARPGAAAIGTFANPVANFEYIGGSGGTTAFIYGTGAGTSSIFFGHAGVLDDFRPGWAGDMNRILGLLSFNGQAADNDY